MLISPVVAIILMATPHSEPELAIGVVALVLAPAIVYYMRRVLSKAKISNLE